jgi:flagellar hook-length control protein FliK
MTISLSPSTANFLPSSMVDNQATKSLSDNKAFDDQLQKGISSLREPIEKTGKVTSSIDTETEQDTPITTTVDISPELAQQNFLALIMNVRPPLSPLNIPQTNSDTGSSQPSSTVKPAISGTLNGIADLPVKVATIAPTPLSADRQYTEIKPTPVASNTTKSESAVTPAIANTLKTTIEQPIKATTTTPAPLSVSHQYSNVKPTQVPLTPVAPEISPDISRPEPPVNAQPMLSAPTNLAITYPPSNAINSAPTSATYNISQSFDSPNWDKAINQQVVWMVQNKLQTASLTINPPHLGPVQIMMQIDNQQATVQFVSEQPEIREALQNALPLLADMLKQSGIQLGHADVSSQHKNSDQKPLPNQSKTNKNPVDTSVTEPVINTQHTKNAGQGLINLIV